LKICAIEVATEIYNSGHGLQIRAIGLGELKLKSTGVISIINAITKKVISTISFSKSTD
jgi:hypothetical protein